MVLYVKGGRVPWRNLLGGADALDSEVSLEDGESTANKPGNRLQRMLE